MSVQTPDDGFERTLHTVTSHILARHLSLRDLPTLPSQSDIANTISSLPPTLPKRGLGTEDATAYLLNALLPGCLQAQNGPKYFGFVIGGVTPAAQLADILAGSYDENVHVTLPGVTASTAIEARTLELVLDLLHIRRESYRGRTITTGATASNVLGLACARDHLYSESPHLPPGYSFAQDGPPSGPTIPSPPITILALHPHFSIVKAAALVGLGGGPKVVKTIRAASDDELTFDLDALKARLVEEKKVGRGVIVAYGLGEVNTGGFGRGLEEIAQMCKEYGAWLHVDAAFGGFAAIVPELVHLTKGMDMADSLTLDGHKWLNVPYDCGLFFTRQGSSLTNVFAPPQASAPAYLASSAKSSGMPNARPGHEIVHESVPSPLYTGIENSRRFRALPLIASLMSLGRQGYIDLVWRNIAFARRIAEYIDASRFYELLNPSASSTSTTPTERSTKAIIPLNIVLFRGSAGSRFAPSDPTSSTRLTSAINTTRKMYVTGTKWRGEGAIRLAVSNWRTGSGGDEEVQAVIDILEVVMQE